MRECRSFSDSQQLEKQLRANSGRPIPEVLNLTFEAADKQLEKDLREPESRGGCTAVVALVRAEPARGTERERHMLYTANVGDGRAVLSRKGKAIRLTYDHKGSDSLESRRISNSGGFLLNHRVNGVLAVTRSLGDFAMKEFIIGAPYTTALELREGDDFLIVACDGVRTARVRH